MSAMTMHQAVAELRKLGYQKAGAYTQKNCPTPAERKELLEKKEALFPGVGYYAIPAMERKQFRGIQNYPYSLGDSDGFCFFVMGRGDTWEEALEKAKVCHAETLKYREKMKKPSLKK